MPTSPRPFLIVASAFLLPTLATGALAGPTDAVRLEPSSAVRSVPARVTAPAQFRAHPRRGKAGLGKVLSTADGGQIFGWDINQNGDDGVLTTAQDVGTSDFKVSMETFDQNTGKIVKVFKKYTGPRNSYEVDGIFANDVALVTHFIIPKGTIFAKRRYEMMNPVTANRFTGSWTPPIKDLSVLMNAENQSTTTSVVYAIELQNNDVPDLISSYIAANTFGPVIHLDPAVYSLGNGPQLAQDTATNQAVVATSPSFGAVGGGPPLIAMADLSTGNITSFNGINNGPFHAGFVNGIAVDSNTGIAVTDSELNAQVEFYTLATKSGFAVQLPNTTNTSQLNSGVAIANDPINGLFLVAQPVSSTAPSGSSIHVYDESGNLVESINGFNFSQRFAVIPIRVAINPHKRIGWVEAANVNQLQQFSY
jgi:hypothetical protein